ncbi:MAG: hypothetical protein WDA03_08340 [Trueperaceae bacterium]
MATFPFSRVLNYERLPIDAQDIVTKARIVIVSQETTEHSFAMTSAFGNLPPNHTVIPYRPVPVTVEYESPYHSLYGAERSFSLPAGVDPFLPAPHSMIPNPIASPAIPDLNNIRDGDLTTYASVSGGSGGSIQYAVHPPYVPAIEGRVVIGFRIVYDLTLLGAPAPGNATYPLNADLYLAHNFGTSEILVSKIAYSLPATAESGEFVAYWPRPIVNQVQDRPILSGGGQWVRLIYIPTGFSKLDIFEFYPLIVNTALVTDIAKAQIRVPASTPRRVQVRGYLPPGDLTHTIVGWPGGDFTGVVARQTYRDMSTIVDFEQTGAPPGVPQELLEAERVRVNRTNELIRAAEYPSLIGRRR